MNISVWRPVDKFIGEGYLSPAQTYQYSIADAIPDTATQFLVYATINCGGNLEEPNVFVDVSVFVNIDGMRLSKYLQVVGYPQEAYNTNSDNMWFPVPSSMVINVEVPYPVYGICRFRLTATGYC